MNASSGSALKPARISMRRDISHSSPPGDVAAASGTRAPSAARTQDAFIALAMGAAEDAAARRVIAFQKPRGRCLGRCVPCSHVAGAADRVDPALLARDLQA